MIVLLISNSAFLRKLMIATLEGPNVFFLEAATGQEALTLYQSHSIGLIIYDLQTEADLEAISGIRAWDREAQIVIVGILGPTVAAALKLGAIDYVEKPFSQYQFRKQIYTLLQHQINKCSIRLDNHSQ